MNYQPRHNSYGQAALDRECEVLAGTSSGRNAQLNSSSFSIGMLVGAGVIDRRTAEGRLYAAAEANGYVQKDGPAATRATIRSGLDKGMRQPRHIPDATRPPSIFFSGMSASSAVPDRTVLELG